MRKGKLKSEAVNATRAVFREEKPTASAFPVLAREKDACFFLREFKAKRAYTQCHIFF